VSSGDIHAPDARSDEIEIRRMSPTESHALVRLARECYGDSYEERWIYDAGAIAARIEQGLMLSVVAVDANEIVGHLAIDRDDPHQRVGESAHATVDPSERGRHVFERMKTHLADVAKDEQLFGLFSEATAAHPFSQKGNLAIGAHEMGYLLGYIPAGVEYAKIQSGDASHRLSVAIMYLRTNDEPERDTHVPDAYAGIVQRIYDNAGLRRRIVSTQAAAGEPDHQTKITIEPHRDHNEVLIRVWSAGPDALDAVAVRLREAVENNVDCVHLGLPMSSAAASMGDALAELGFFFGCVVPELRPDGDALRLQFLNGVDPHTADIATASDFGRDLLAEISAAIP
jgi:serine/threonine-protein kinase RsbW